MIKPLLSIILLVTASIGFSQTMPTLAKTSNLTPITINNNDTLLVPVGDSVWIGNIDVWNFNFFGDPNGNHFYLHKSDIAWTAVTTIDTVVIGNNDKFRFNVPIMTKYRYVIRREFMTTQDITFYVRGTTGSVSGIMNIKNTGSNVVLFPNPTSDQLNISGLNKNQKTLLITNILGEVLNIIETNGSESLAVDVKNLAPGVYFIVLNSKVLKFIKE